jgi:hypothetical protein
LRFIVCPRRSSFFLASLREDIATLDGEARRAVLNDDECTLGGDIPAA